MELLQPQKPIIQSCRRLDQGGGKVASRTASSGFKMLMTRPLIVHILCHFQGSVNFPSISKQRACVNYGSAFMTLIITKRSSTT